MIKKLPFLLAIIAILLSCEKESFDESVVSPESTPEENLPQDDSPIITTEKIIDNYIEVDGGLNN
ncbi:hypothetical protein [Aquimarina aquimarini]|uniref:hypothetical protein n=1 Tax=Aquimarina aquimarini TaxID=1191734 RepID=UPI001F2D49A9|nr:hypothetical protein [Aquimarina aquimarini]